MMKIKFSLILLVLLTLTSVKSFAQEFVLTTTKANVSGNRAIIDLPGLNGNSDAIILITPLPSTQSLNPRTVGVFYNENKWEIFNLDQTAMPVGAKYKLEFVLKPTANQFLHIVTDQNIRGENSDIDNPALNNNPTAQFKISLNWSPSTRGGDYNRFETKIGYNTASGKWYIANINGKSMYRKWAYNILITSEGTVSTISSIPQPTPQPATGVLITPPPTPIITAVTPQPTPIISTTSSTIPVINASTKSIQLAFDSLNDFVEKGLPASAALPTDNLDLAAIIMARQISKGDEQSLPVLLTALQTSGFIVIDENGKALLKPADGKGQGLGFYDFEAVGALKLADRGINISLEKMASVITKNTPELPASQLAELMLKNLRTQAENNDNKFVRFWARLIIELGKSSAQPIDLMTAPASQVNLSLLQATLLTRRLQGDFYNLKTNQTGMNKPPFSQGNSFVSAFWKTNDLPFFRPVFYSEKNNSPCNLTGDEALILDAAAIEISFWNGWQMSQLGDSLKLKQLGYGLQGANAALAWLKLVASVTMMKGEIIVQKPLPLVRTKNSNTQELSNKRLMVARVWSEVGKTEMLNCVRPLINAATGLDFNLPTNGPLADVAIEWNFEGENQTRVNDAATRNTEKFVVFETEKGAPANPQKQVTNNLGLSKMWLVGAPKIPAVAYQTNPIKIEKKAEVLVAVTLKSAKDVKQNLIDFLGTVISVASAKKADDPWGLLGLIGSAAEIGYRAPYIAARAMIPVTDHEPCDGQWQGTISYTYIYESKSNTITKPPPEGYAGAKGTGHSGGYENQNMTITQSGTISVNGNEFVGNSSVDEIFSVEKFSSGKQYCHGGLGGPKGPLVAASSISSQTRYGGGNRQGIVSGSISLNKDSYKISIKPLTINGVLQSSSATSSTGGCPPGSPSTSNNSSQKWQWGSNDYISGTGKYEADRNILSGSFTETNSLPSSSSPPTQKGMTISTSTGTTTTVRTITWNLQRCNK